MEVPTILNAYSNEVFISRPYDPVNKVEKGLTANDNYASEIIGG